jgi:hypothetical protein
VRNQDLTGVQSAVQQIANGTNGGTPICAPESVQKLIGIFRQSRHARLDVPNILFLSSWVRRCLTNN